MWFILPAYIYDDDVHIYMATFVTEDKEDGEVEKVAAVTSLKVASGDSAPGPGSTPSVAGQVFSSATLANIKEKILEVQQQVGKEEQQIAADERKRTFDDTPPNRGYLLEPEPYEADSEEDEESLKQANYFDNWDSYEAFKCVNVLKQNVGVIRDEMNAVKDWRPWPEKNLYGRRKKWNVFPFLHTFPATDPEKSTWVERFCDQCPKTVQLLKGLPGIRTALLSRMGPGTVLAPHRGWADLANHVLRFHLALEVPGKKGCGLWVRGEKRFHAEGEIICFDDSKLHKAFNLAEQERTVLIFDMMRPEGIPLGTAKKGHTDQLDDFIAWFQ